MPQKHSPKQQRQAKHIVAGYKKRGVPMKKAKSIAWATVNKQQNESWMFNGAGQPVFMGNQGNVSQFNPSGSVSPGASYVPDEVAMMLVKESGLRKSDTISKKVIEGYLESMRLSRGLAVDVAKVLRDVYGITPTFDESTLYARSGALIEELTAAVESFPMPFAVDDEPKELTEADIIGSFIQGEFLESTDENYDVALGVLATLSPDEFCDVVDFHEWVGPEVFNYIESIAVNGPDGAAEKVVEGLCWPHRIQFMPEHIQDIFTDSIQPIIEANGFGGFAHIGKGHKIPAPPEGSFHKEGPKVGKEIAGQNKEWSSKIKAAKARAAQQAKQQTGKAAKKERGKDWKAAQQRQGTTVKKARRELGQATPGPGGSSARSKFDALRSERAAKEKANSDEKAKGFHAQRTAEKADADTASAEKPSDPSPSRMKRAGSTAIGAMKKAAGATGSMAVGAAGHLVGAAGHVVGAGLKGLARGMFGKKKEADSGSSSGRKGQSTSPPKESKPGLISRASGHIARAVGKFAKHVAHNAKEGFKNATPGLQAQTGGEAEPKKDKKVVAPAVGDSVYRSGPVLDEVSAALSGVLPFDEEEIEEAELSPADITATLEGTTVVDMAVLEALGEMEWNGVAGIAGFMVLEPDRFLSLIQSFKESRSVFRAEWSELEESGGKPAWMNVGSFVALANLSLDEDVIPRLVYWAGRTLQAASDGVASHIGEAYPELGKTVYGPAGNPKEGPELAKSFMTPHPAGSMTPAAGDCTTRMFSDPDDREKARKSKLADVMAALDGMRSAAADAGVPPEGMFLNLYRDMHREKVRYS